MSLKRSIGPTRTEQHQPLGRVNAYFGMYVGIVKDNKDIQRMGRLRVWIPEFGSKPEDELGWTLVSYASPFAGATNPYLQGKNIQRFEDTQTSYGLWMIPPDTGNQVLVMFANGDIHRGFWFACAYQQFMNNMVPGMSANVDNYQYGGKYIPIAEYNKWNTTILDPDLAKHPYQKTKFQGLGTQGLITDELRGTTNTSARRESPSQVFGILTPGPVEPGSAGTTSSIVGEIESPRRKGGSAFYMDDGEGHEQVVLTTKSGSKIQLDETKGFVYIINRDGTSWMSLDKEGNVDVFGAKNISLRAQQDINLRADRNINIEAGQNLFIKAAKDTVKSTAPFTYNVNNVPEKKMVEYYRNVGEGNGDGGNIVVQALKNWHMTAKEYGKITIEEQNLDIKVKKQFYLTTEEGGQQYYAKQGIKLTMDGAYDLVATNSVRMFSGADFNIIGTSRVSICSDGTVGIKSTSNIDVKSDGPVNVDGATVNVNSGAANPPNVSTPMKAGKANTAEKKPMNDLVNVLYTWKDPESKFIRFSENIKSTTSRFPTFEPSPVHAGSVGKGLTKEPVALTNYDKKSEGGGGTQQPSNNPDPTLNNTDATPDPQNDSNAIPHTETDQLRCEIKRHEGYKTRTYLDSVGLATGGVGHLMTPSDLAKYPLGANIPADQVETWFNYDLTKHTIIAQNCIGEPTFSDLDDTRRRACINLGYNLGYRLNGFRAFISAMRAKNYEAAGNELLSSAWFRQVGVRGPDIVQMIKTGKSPIKCG